MLAAERAFLDAGLTLPIAERDDYCQELMRVIQAHLDNLPIRCGGLVTFAESREVWADA